MFKTIIACFVIVAFCFLLDGLVRPTRDDLHVATCYEICDESYGPRSESDSGLRTELRIICETRCGEMKAGKSDLENYEAEIKFFSQEKDKACRRAVLQYSPPETVDKTSGCAYAAKAIPAFFLITAH